MLAFLIWLGIGMMLSAFAVPLLAGLYWKRATAKGAIASMTCGILAALLFGCYSYFKLGPALPMHFSIYSFGIAIIAMIVVSLLTKKNSEEALEKTYTGFYMFPKDEKKE